MRKAFLTSGPSGSGKSQYVRKLIEAHPEVALVSRDEILMRMFGTVWFGSYEAGCFDVAIDAMWESATRLLVPADARLVVDCWNGSSRERQWLVTKLHELGVDQVICLQFVVPIETCVRWCLEKPGMAALDAFAIRHNYKHYYHTAAGINQDGFDQVVRVRPDEPQSLEFTFL